MSGRIADFFRFWWALLYWNARKTAFRIRRERRRSPCQSASDSGRALETRCEACVFWNDPRRFRRVCPLLVETANGLRCSVDTPEVRPFWLRAIGFGTAAALTLYLIATMAAFSAARAIGYPVSYVAIAWPPAWRQINEARGEYFLQKGIRALEAKNPKEALFSLSLAYDLAPRNYEIGLTLASLWQMSQPVLSDQLYVRLLQEHPANESRTADAWHRALLARGDYAKIKRLAVQELRRLEAAHAGYWMNALLFAANRTRDPVPLRALLTGQPSLDSSLQQILEIELLLLEGRSHDALLRLQQPPPEVAPPFLPYYQAAALIRSGHAQTALEFLDRHARQFRDDESYRLRLDALASLGWQTVLNSDVELLLSQPTPAVVELIATHLVKFPNRDLLERVFVRIEQQPLPRTPASRGALVALFCASGAGHDFARMDQAAHLLRTATGADLAVLQAFGDFFREKSGSQRIQTFLPSLPLPLELTYALLERYADTRPRAPGSTK